MNLNFSVSMYGSLEQYNDVLSKGRCRIFYKYGNRNGTYITDDFAEKLLSTIPYAPVKGIYDFEEEDYTDHGKKRTEGRIYGVVPENPNLTWELHLDEDGVEREYACVDVLVFTGLYKEAKEIIGKAQSMELYDKTIKGEWQIIDGKRYFVFTSGSFLGLQALGEEVEPCFQGASFFSLQPILDLVKKYESFQNKGGQQMNMTFKLSDGQKLDALWSLLNPNYDENGDWIIDYVVYDVYDNYAVVRNLQEQIYERVYYSKDDSTDSLILGDKERCFIIDVNEHEKTALEAIHNLNGGTYENAGANYQALQEKNSIMEQKVEELNNNLVTLTIERDNIFSSLETSKTQIDELTVAIDNASAQLIGAQGEIETLKQENYALSTFKADIELKEKKEVLEKYSGSLSENILEKYSSNLDAYTVNDLKKELAFELVESSPLMFSKDSNPGYVPKDIPKSGIESILSKYKK